MTEPHVAFARRAAARLAESLDSGLPEQVDRELATAADRDEPRKFIDPGTAIGLGSLIVSLASLGWTIYRDLKQSGATPTVTSVARRVRVQVGTVQSASIEDRDRIIEVVVEEIVAGGETTD